MWFFESELLPTRLGECMCSISPIGVLMAIEFRSYVPNFEEALLVFSLTRTGSMRQTHKNLFEFGKRE